MARTDVATQAATAAVPRRRIETAALVALVGLPIVALVAVLAHRTWFPTGDLAQAELRMRSLPRHPPLVGAAGRITDRDQVQGNHPGPLMFWVTWPLYELLGRSSWAFEAATALVGLAWLATATWLVRKQASLAVALWFAAVALVLAGGLGLDGLSQPWNPWVSIFPFLVLVLTAWRSVEGWPWAPVLGVAAASYAIQGHAGYLPVALPLVAVCVVAPAVVAFRARSGSRDAAGERDRAATEPAHELFAADPQPTEPPSRPAVRRALPLVLAVVVGVALWSGPLWDAATSHPSNVHKLIDNFRYPTDPPIGFAVGLRTVLRAMSPAGAWVHGGVLPAGSVAPGLVLLVAWVGVAAAVAGSGREHRALIRLDAVLAVALVCGLVAVTRIFGAPFLYVFRWITVLEALVVFTLGWGIATLLPPPPTAWRDLGRPALAVGAVAVLVLSAATAVRVGRQPIPYGYSWRMEQVLAPQAAGELRRGRRYLVAWQDPVYLGGLGFGLLLELERRGFSVGAGPTTEAAVEPHRVLCPGQYQGVLTVVTGPRAIARWKALADTREVASVGAAPGFNYPATATRLRRALAARGVHDTPDQLEQALSLIVLSPAATPEISRLASSLVTHGVPSAVFLQDPAPKVAPLPHTPANAPCTGG